MAERAAIGMCFDRTFPGAAVTEFARRLEDGGVDEMWFVEDCFFTTAPPLAAAALATTDRLTVGLGILPAVARTAAVTAMEIATLASIGPGRVIGGIGHGIQSWMAQMGVRAGSPLGAFEEVVTGVRRLLAGETVSMTGEYVTLDGVALEHRPDPVPPVLAGVSGPKSLALAGRVADGVVLSGPSTVPHVAEARAAAGDRAGYQVTTFTTFSLAADRLDAHRRVAPFVAQMLGSVGFRDLPFLGDLRALHAERGLDGIAGMPRDWWLQIAAVGTLEDVLEHVALLEAAGATSVAFFPAPDLDIARHQADDVVAVAAAR